MRPSAPISLPASPKRYLIQLKYDGWNVVLSNGRIYTRRGKDITGWGCWGGSNLYLQYPGNGELMAAAGHSRNNIQAVRAGRVAPLIVLFDLCVPDVPLEERLALLAEQRLGPDQRIAPVFGPLSTWDEVNAFLSRVSGSNVEGIVLKEKGSLYTPSGLGSICSPAWIKIKAPIQFVDPQKRGCKA